MKKTVLILLGVVFSTALFCAVFFLVWNSLHSVYYVVNLPENYKIITSGEGASLLIVTENGSLYELDSDNRLILQNRVLEGIADLKLDPDTGICLALREDGTIFTFQLSDDTATKKDIMIPANIT